MRDNYEFAGRVRVWLDRGKWKWCHEDQQAPLGAKIAVRYLGNLEEVIYLKHDEEHGEFIRGAVQAGC